MPSAKENLVITDLEDLYMITIGQDRRTHDNIYVRFHRRNLNLEIAQGNRILFLHPPAIPELVEALRLLQGELQKFGKGIHD